MPVLVRSILQAIWRYVPFERRDTHTFAAIDSRPGFSSDLQVPSSELGSHARRIFE